MCVRLILFHLILTNISSHFIEENFIFHCNEFLLNCSLCDVAHMAREGGGSLPLSLPDSLQRARHGPGGPADRRPGCARDERRCSDLRARPVSAFRTSSLPREPERPAHGRSSASAGQQPPALAPLDLLRLRVQVRVIPPAGNRLALWRSTR